EHWDECRLDAPDGSVAINVDRLVALVEAGAIAGARADVKTAFLKRDPHDTVGDARREARSTHADGSERRLNLVGFLGRDARRKSEGALAETQHDGVRLVAAVHELVERHRRACSERQARLVDELQLEDAAWSGLNRFIAKDLRADGKPPRLR